MHNTKSVFYNTKSNICVTFVLRKMLHLQQKKVINIINTINMTTSKLLSKLLTLNYPQKQTKTSLHYKVINMTKY